MWEVNSLFMDLKLKRSSIDNYGLVIAVFWQVVAGINNTEAAFIVLAVGHDPKSNCKRNLCSINNTSRQFSLLWIGRICVYGDKHSCPNKRHTINRLSRQSLTVKGSGYKPRPPLHFCARTKRLTILSVNILLKKK